MKINMNFITFATLKRICYAKNENPFKCKEKIQLYRNRKVEEISGKCTTHLMRKKSNKAKTRLLGSALVSDADYAKVKNLLCK